MEKLKFEWDPNKGASNVVKHHVSFEEAKAVFLDPEALVIPDPDHSSNEPRFVILGMGGENRVLVVVHCFRSKETIIRIISARRAGTKEKAQYWTTRL